MVLVASSLTFWFLPRDRMSFWVCGPSLVSASSGATSKRSFLRARMRRPPEDLRVERPCQRDIRTPGVGSATKRGYLAAAPRTGDGFAQAGHVDAAVQVGAAGDELDGIGLGGVGGADVEA